MNDMAGDDQDDAARAFRELTAEVTVMRRAMEAMAAREPTDYSPTLGDIAKRLDGLTTVTKAMSERPAMTMTPETYAAQLRRATEDAARPLLAELQRAQGLTGQIERALGTVRNQQAHRIAVLRAGLIGLVIGVVVVVLVVPIILRALPEGWHVPERASAYVIGDDRWTSGQAMMAGADPEGWARVVRAVNSERDAPDEAR